MELYLDQDRAIKKLHGVDRRESKRTLQDDNFAAPSFGEESAVNPRRLLGAYYTPDELAGVLAEWAIAPKTGTVLDPSFGGCAFMNAATKVLKNRGVVDPGRLVYGVDVDPSCMDYVRASPDLFERNCTVRDFLTLSPEHLRGMPFQALIGNPPYVRHHWLNGSTRQAGQAAISPFGVTLSGRASAWAYFLIHALNFIAKHGRLALLVPEAILQADYASVVRDLLRSRFDCVRLVHIRDRLFAGTNEPVVAVAASKYGGSQGIFRVDAVERSEDLEGVLNSPTIGYSTLHLVTSKGRRIDSLSVQLLSELEQIPSVRKLADVATVRVGLVTGANRHFIRNAENLKQLGVPDKSWVRLISRTRWLTGLEFTEEDLGKIEDAGQNAILVRPTPTCEKTPGIKDWIAEGTKSGIHERFKCTLRDPWYRVELQSAPDAFATCTRMGSPLIVLNRAGCQCTNALHAVHLRCSSDVSLPAMAVGFLTSAASVWAELHGRRYGGGVLKMEPGTLGHTPVPIVQGGENAFDELNELIRLGRETEARKRADDLVLVDKLGVKKKDVRRLQLAHARLMDQRRPARNGTNNG